jgi:hypothetical protein
MSDFNSAFLTQQQRLSIAKASLPSDNIAAYDSLIRADKVTDLLKPFLGRSVPGFTEYTPACFQQIFATAFAVDSKTSLAKARGDGRLATAVDHIRSIGNGFRHNVRSIERFLRIDEAELVYSKKQHFKATMPEITDLYQSAYYYGQMEKALVLRAKATASGEKLSKEELQLHLLTPGWTEDKILQYTTEYIARAFAKRMPDSERSGLIQGDLTFEDALKKCELLPMAAAA